MIARAHGARQSEARSATPSLTASRARSLALACLLISACGGARLVTVPRGPGPAHGALVSVDYPPPPAKIEEVVLARHGGARCVWRDGFWDWTGRRWEWQSGHAVLSPPGCLFARAKLEWGADSLSFYRPAWYPDPAQSPLRKTCPELACIPTAYSGTPESE